jgi:hypothetical protein
LSVNSIKINLDFLSMDFIFRINWISNPSKPGVFDFFVVTIRSVAFAWITFFIIYSIWYKGSGIREFDLIEFTWFIFVYAFFEEQSRWIFSSAAENSVRSCLIFFFLMVTLETLLFWVISQEVGFFDYIKARVGSIITHAVNTWLCYVSNRYNFVKKFFLFSIAVSFHCLMNIYGIHFIVETLLGE